MKNNTPIMINGKESKIFCSESRSHKKDKANIYNFEMITIIDELLKGYESDLKYPRGITTLNTLTSWDEPRLRIKRLSNKILELRKILPPNTILTFRDFNNSKDEWKYAVKKDNDIIFSIVYLKKKILQEIDKRKNY